MNIISITLAVEDGHQELIQAIREIIESRQINIRSEIQLSNHYNIIAEKKSSFKQEQDVNDELESSCGCPDEPNDIQQDAIMAIEPTTISVSDVMQNDPVIAANEPQYTPCRILNIGDDRPFNAECDTEISCPELYVHNLVNLPDSVQFELNGITIHFSKVFGNEIDSTLDCTIRVTLHLIEANKIVSCVIKLINIDSNSPNMLKMPANLLSSI